MGGEAGEHGGEVLLEVGGGEGGDDLREGGDGGGADRGLFHGEEELEGGKEKVHVFGPAEVGRGEEGQGGGELWENWGLGGRFRGKYKMTCNGESLGDTLLTFRRTKSSSSMLSLKKGSSSEG